MILRPVTEAIYRALNGLGAALVKEGDESYFIVDEFQTAVIPRAER